MKDFRKKPQATRRRTEIETPLETALATLALIFVFALALAVLFVLDQAWAGSEVRCFETAVGTTYCREQFDWGTN